METNRKAGKAQSRSAGRNAESSHPLDRAKLRMEELDARRAFGRVRREDAGPLSKLLAGAKFLVAKLNTVLPMRVWKLYSTRHGPLMAAGSSYNMFFSIAALLVAGFSIFGIVAAGNQALQDMVVRSVAESTPGLIDTGSGGLATQEQLFASGSGYGWALVISTAAMLLTSLRWIASLREGMRGVFALPPLQGNLLLIKLKDLGTLLILGITLVVTSVVAAVSNTALGAVLDFLAIESAIAAFFTRAAGVLVMLLLDMLVAVVLFRAASGIRMPRSVLFQAALIAGAGSTLLRMFSSTLLGNVGNNPLLAPFAVILGLFVWFFLLSQVYLMATAWGAVGMADVKAKRQAARREGRQLSLRQRARAAHR